MTMFVAVAHGPLLWVIGVDYESLYRTGRPPAMLASAFVIPFALPLAYGISSILIPLSLFFPVKKVENADPPR
jgi:hypothetical protein